MKIVFLCGSLEPGKDGVGDYTLLLATELVRQGHSVKTIALNDKHIKTDAVNSPEVVNGNNIGVLRLSSVTSWYERITKAKDVVAGFNPDWISLQFVPFSFNDKGIPLDLGSKLKQISGSAKWHIMFHELWVGHADKISKKNYWLGQLQKYSIRQLIKTLEAKALNTNTAYYKFLLTKEGHKVSILPLMSNLSVVRANKQDIDTLIESKTKQAGLETKENSQVALIFGSIPSNWDLNPMLDLWQNSLHEYNKYGRLFLLGKHGRPINDIKKIIAQNYSRIDCVEFGVLDAHQLSGIMQVSNFGINPTPLAIYEKSGVVAAMRQHGLSVILTRKGNVRAEFYNMTRELPTGILYIDTIQPIDFLNFEKDDPIDLLPQTAQKLIGFLQT